MYINKRLFVFLVVTIAQIASTTAFSLTTRYAPTQLRQGVVPHTPRKTCSVGYGTRPSIPSWRNIRDPTKTLGLRSSRLYSKTSPEQNDGPMKVESAEDEMFNVKTTISLVGGQSILVGLGVAIGALVGTPNFGLGPSIDFGTSPILFGSLTAIPLGFMAWVLDSVEDRFPALQDVTKATQRSVLALLGGTFKPGIGLVVASMLGIAAGLGEELIFRGILQYELGNRIGEGLAVGLSSIIFGLLHAVTPLYAILASVVSVYFGYLYSSSGNLAVPIVCHALYDIIALFYAHYEVSKLSASEQNALSEWVSPAERG